MADVPLSPVEKIKSASRLLRGTLAEGLADGVTGSIAEDDTQLIKFHGSYQQDDRDLREERRVQKLEPAFSFMIRTRLPGGVCSSAQWLALAALHYQYVEPEPLFDFKRDIAGRHLFAASLETRCRNEGFRADRGQPRHDRIHS